VQVIDHPLQDVSVAFLASDQLSHAAGVLMLPAGFITGQCVLILRDRAVKLRAALAEHPHVVLGLAAVGSFSGREGCLVEIGLASIHRPNLTDTLPTRATSGGPTLPTPIQRCGPRPRRRTANKTRPAEPPCSRLGRR
jgi:hypothetical protein